VGGSGGTFDFISWGQMPSGDYDWGGLYIANITWAVTSDYSSFASDHCDAVAATNIALYYAGNGYSNLKVNGIVDDTFQKLYDRIGDGPVATIASDVKSFATSRGYTMGSSSVWTSSGFIEATADDHPCGILMVEGSNYFLWDANVWSITEYSIN
jgi:hypothetical protein